MPSLFGFLFRVFGFRLEYVQNAGAGQLIGIAAQSQIQRHAGQILPLGVGVDGLCGVCEGAVKGAAEVGIQPLVPLVAGLSGGDELADGADGQHLLKGADGGEIGQMDGTVPLAVRAGNKAVLDVIVDHGGGQRVPIVKADQLTGHIRDQLIHIKGNIRQSIPAGGALLFHAVFQLQQFFHGAISFGKSGYQ